MTNKILYWVTVVFAALALLLFITNACMINGNQRIQADINQRQMTINTAANLAPLNQQLSQALYETSMKNDDTQIRELLTSQGFTLPKAGAKAADKAAEAAKPAAAAPVKKTKKDEE